MPDLDLARMKEAATRASVGLARIFHCGKQAFYRECTPRAVLALIDRLETAEAERAEAVEALNPFGAFGAREVDEDGWKTPPMRERVVDWMGPTDFRRAAAIVAKHAKEATS